MRLKLEILNAAYLYDEKSIDNLNTKQLVPNMMFRRRLTQASKLFIELINKVQFEKGRVFYGTSFGELKATADILNAIVNNSLLSPTDFQNSVYNTAASYCSILNKNENEILTISSGDETSLKVLKAGAIKALDGDEILLICVETLNIDNIDEINRCNAYLEVAVALKVKISKENPTIFLDEKLDKRFPKSVSHMINIAMQFKENNKNIIEIQI